MFLQCCITRAHGAQGLWGTRVLEHIKHKEHEAWKHLGQEAREAWDHVGQVAGRAWEHLRNEQHEAWKNVGQEVRERKARRAQEHIKQEARGLRNLEELLHLVH